jgi:hypothetical protein
MNTATPALAADPPAVLGVRSYSHLAAHHGHDLGVSIYGGDASAALECETCQSILLAFENIPGTQAHLAALLALTRRHRIEARHLTALVTSAATQQVDAVNAQGVRCQLAYLLGTVGAQPARELVERIASETRRP